MTEIAKRAGVSVAVVSRLLRGDPGLRVSKQRRREILIAKDELGGVRIRRGNHALTHTILAPVNRIFSAEWVQDNLSGRDRLIRTVETSLQKDDFHLHFIFFDPAKKDRFFSSLFHQRNRCDGVLLLSQVVDKKISELVRQYDFPHVATGSEAELLRVNTVRPNTTEGIRQAIEHLQEFGHRNIGYLGNRENYRYREFVAIMMSMGLSVDHGLSCLLDPLGEMKTEDELRKFVAQRFGQWLEARPATTALFCQKDNIALGAVDSLLQRGMRPGRELSLVSHDNIEEKGASPVKSPVLTTIDGPLEAIGYRISELLLNQILHSQLQIIHERLPVRLIVRSSTGPCPDPGQD